MNKFFKVGDTIEIIKDHKHPNLRGCIGKIREIDNEKYSHIDNAYYISNYTEFEKYDPRKAKFSGWFYENEIKLHKSKKNKHQVFNI